jgi:predicted nucleotidyltransferase
MIFMEAIQLVKYSGSRKVLETLLKFPNRLFSINELAKQAGVPFASTWRLVQKWEPAGIIETGRVGKSVTVRLRKSEYTDSISSLLNASVSPQAFTARAVKELIAGDKEVKEAFLFGSVTAGKETLASDVDVALLVEKGFDANKLVFDVYEKYGTKVVPLAFFKKNEFESFMADKKGERLK